MKAEINNQNKAKFFALYYDECVLMRASYVKSTDIVNIKGGFEIDVYGEELYLSLKPISSISDEDAKKLLYDSASKFKRASNARLHIDELRVMGYAMNWHGLTVQEMVNAGWIKLQEI